MDPQDLTDRIVVAIEEQDVLYVLHWVGEMREEGCLEEAINNKHSWKGYSALESLIKSPFTQLRRLILEILLSQGADSRVEAGNRKNGSEEALQVLMNWETSGKQAAKDARHLLSVSLEEAAEWIDQNLPPPPNASSLTGCNDPTPHSASSPSYLTASNGISMSVSETDSKPSSNSSKLVTQPKSQTPRTGSPSPNYRFSRLESVSLQATDLPSSPGVDPRSRFSERFQTIIPTPFPIPRYSPLRPILRPVASLPTPPYSISSSTPDSATFTDTRTEHQSANVNMKLDESASPLFTIETSPHINNLEEGEIPSDTELVDHGEKCRSSSTPSRFSPLPCSFQPTFSSLPSKSTTQSQQALSLDDTTLDIESNGPADTPNTSIESGTQDSPPFVRLYLGCLPPRTLVSDVEQLFIVINVGCSVDWRHPKVALDGFVFVDIRPDKVAHCIEQLHGRQLGTHLITCSVARSCSTPKPLNPNQRVNRDLDYSTESTVALHYDEAPRKPSSPVPLDLASQLLSVSSNLLILNLPLHSTFRALEFLNNFPNRQVFQLHSRNQAVAFVSTSTEVEADLIVREHDGRLISGEKISIVLTKRGLSGEEAVLDYFGRGDS